MESNKLYVGNLTYSVNAEQLKELFAPVRDGERRQSH